MKKALLLGWLLLAAAGVAGAEEPLAQKPAPDRSARSRRTRATRSGREILVFSTC